MVRLYRVVKSKCQSMVWVKGPNDSGFSNALTDDSPGAAGIFTVVPGMEMRAGEVVLPAGTELDRNQFVVTGGLSWRFGDFDKKKGK